MTALAGYAGGFFQSFGDGNQDAGNSGRQHERDESFGGGPAVGICSICTQSACGCYFQRSSAGMYPSYAKMAQSLGLQPLGYFPVVPQASVESRHLGLVTAGEIENLKEKMMLLAETAEKTLDLDGILQLAQSTVTLEYKKPSLPPLQQVSVRIGVALDEAFCFYYADNLKLLEEMGAKLVPFSPLHDKSLPPDLDGLYLGGGYPELYARSLAENETMRQSVRQAVTNEMPTIAECGGFLYLQQSLADRTGNDFPMAGALPGKGQMTIAWSGLAMWIFYRAGSK